MEPIITNYTLVKLASRCNINCKYCYWFKDRSVYEKPPILTIEAEEAFVEKLKIHIVENSLKSYFILFHGGEPLLFGKGRFENFCRKLRELERELEFVLRLSVTTNGILLDSEWMHIFQRYKVSVTVSIDGSQEVHDSNRVDFKGNGTSDEVVRGIKLLQKFQVNFGLLSVCNPDSNPRDLVDYFVNELDVYHFDVLIPDANHDSGHESIAEYYKVLFDVWLDEYSQRKVRIRILENLIKGVVGIGSTSESFGLGPNTTYTLHTDGTLEALDILRIAGESFTKSSLNVFDNKLCEVYRNELFLETYRSNVELNELCVACEFKFACGGGHIAHRWSGKNRFNNPSVYCSDFKKVFSHVVSRMSEIVTIHKV